MKRRKGVVRVVILVFTLAFSLDALVAGLACGLARLRLHPAAAVVVALTAAAALAAGAGVGRAAAAVVSPVAARWLGSGLLGATGLWLVLSTRGGRPAAQAAAADRDASGDLSLPELAGLGTGLGADGFAGAVGLVLRGLSVRDLVVLTAACSLASAVAFRAGLAAGARLDVAAAHDALPTAPRVLTGLMLLVLAVARAVR